MFIKKHWKSELVILGLFMIGAMVLFPGARGGDLKASAAIGSAGRHLSDKHVLALNRLHDDLKSMGEVISVQPQRIAWRDESGRLREYGFAYDALWCGYDPVILRVKAFHFEFRDRWGNLLTRAAQNPEAVESVGYVIRFQSNDQDIVTSSRIVL